MKKKFLRMISAALACAAFLCGSQLLPAAAQEVTAEGSFDLTLTAVVEAPEFHASDSKTGIIASAVEGVVISGATLAANEIGPNDPEYENVSGALKQAASKFKVFRIGLELGGVNQRLSGKLTLQIPIPSGFNTNKLKLYFIDANGTKTELSFELDNKSQSILFETSELGVFALAESSAAGSSSKGTDDVETGDAAAWIVAFSVFAAVVFVGLKRRKSVN